MFGMILDSELIKRIKLVWNKIWNWMIVDIVCYLFNYGVLFYVFFYFLLLMCVLFGIILCSIFK